MPAGTLPSAWAAAGSFPQLTQLDLTSTQLQGTLPAAWGSSGSFASLQALYLGDTALTSSLPASWGSTDAWQQLQTLYILSSKITGDSFIEAELAMPCSLVQNSPHLCASARHGVLHSTSYPVGQCTLAVAWPSLHLPT